MHQAFGNDIFEERNISTAKKYLNKFKSLSVREFSGKEKARKICNRNAEVVLDPTLLLKKEEWESIIDFKPSIPHYILVYIPHNQKKVFDFVHKLKKKTGLPIVYLSISPRIQIKTKTIYDASPEEFLGWIKYADYVVTGSFHGVAFSLNMNKQFFYEPTGEGSRIDNLVKITGTENRSISNEDCMEQEIDFSLVNDRINNERMKSIKWLEDAISAKE